MCQVTDGGSDQLEKKPTFRSGKDCMKCGEKAVVVARIHDPLCRNCFLTYFSHRFRATMGKSRLLRDGDKVLVGISGGQNSCAMLHLIKQVTRLRTAKRCQFIWHLSEESEGLGVTAQKKIRFNPSLVYIDEGAVIGQSRAERVANQKTVCQYLEESGLSWHTATLEEVLDNSSSQTTCEANNSSCHDNNKPSQDALADRLDGLSMDDGKGERLRQLLATVKSLTSKQDLVQRLRHELLLRLAKRHGYCKVMLGNTSTSLSASILANIAQGRGAAVPLDMGFSDNRHGDVTFVRPMRELTNKEVALYNKLCEVDSIFIPTLATKAGEYASINTLTEAFVNGLQANFPSTVSTVFRTGEKLTVSNDSESIKKEKCAMCSAHLDTSTTAGCSALSATQFSLSVTGPECNQIDSTGSMCGDSSSSTECCGQGDGSCSSTSKNELPSRKQIQARLCYGCQLTVKDVTDVDLLPSFILEEVGRQERRSQMRDEIQDFLLEDS